MLMSVRNGFFVSVSEPDFYSFVHLFIYPSFPQIVCLRIEIKTSAIITGAEIGF